MFHVKHLCLLHTVQQTKLYPTIHFACVYPFESVKDRLGNQWGCCKRFPTDVSTLVSVCCITSNLFSIVWNLFSLLLACCSSYKTFCCSLPNSSADLSLSFMKLKYANTTPTIDAMLAIVLASTFI